LRFAVSVWYIVPQSRVKIYRFIHFTERTLCETTSSQTQQTQFDLKTAERKESTAKSTFPGNISSAFLSTAIIPASAEKRIRIMPPNTNRGLARSRPETPQGPHRRAHI
jgi:hypothetical protein